MRSAEHELWGKAGMEGKLKSCIQRAIESINSRSIVDHIYDVMTYLGSKGYGVVEAINTVIFTPILLFTVWWASASFLPSVPGRWDWSEFHLTLLATLTVTSAYIILTSAIFLNHHHLPQGHPTRMRLAKRTYRFVLYVLFGALGVSLIYLGVSIIGNVYRWQWALLSFIIVYTLFTYKFYSLMSQQRYISGYIENPAEGLLGIFDLLIWTILIMGTGRGESPFYYLYAVTLFATFRRGFPKDNSSCQRSSHIKHSFIESVSISWSSKIWLPFIITLFWLLCASVIDNVWMSLHSSGRGVISIFDIMSNYGSYLLPTIPWLLLVLVIVFVMQFDNEQLDALRKSMEAKAVADWQSSDVRDPIVELALNIARFPFNSTKMIVIDTDRGRNDHALLSVNRVYYVDFINQIKRKLKQEYEEINLKEWVREKISYNDIAGDELWMPKQLLCNNCSSCKLMGTSTSHPMGCPQCLYFVKNEFVPGLREAFNDIGVDIDKVIYNSFWVNCNSLCCVTIPHIGIDDSGGTVKYSVILIGSDLAGEFNATVGEIYEAISAQIIGIYKRYKLYSEETAKSARAIERAALMIFLMKGKHLSKSCAMTSIQTLCNMA